MKIDYTPDNPTTDAACKEMTGKSYAEWFAVIDAKGGPSLGRREITNHLYNDLKVDIWWCSTINMAYEAHNGVKEKDGRSKGYFICSTKTIAAPVADVFNAFATAKGLAGWFGAVSGDLVDGSIVTDADGNSLDVKRVRENKDLRFGWKGTRGDESLVDVQFTDKGNGKMGLLVNHDRIQSREEADGLRRAWAAAIDVLKKNLEGK